MSFEMTRFTLCRWLTGATAEIEEFAKAHGASTAEDFDGASLWDISYEAQRWPDVAFTDIKDYQREDA